LFLLFSSLAFGLSVLLALMGRLTTTTLPFRRLPTPNFSQAVGVLAVALVPAARLKTVATVFTQTKPRRQTASGSGFPVVVEGILDSSHGRSFAPSGPPGRF
jgi:hypothetical protein